MAKAMRLSLRPDAKPRKSGKLALFEVLRNGGGEGDPADAAPAAAPVIVTREASRTPSRMPFGGWRPGPGHAALAAAGVVVLVAGAFLTGRLVSGGGEAVPAEVSAVIMPEVLDVPVTVTATPSPGTLARPAGSPLSVTPVDVPVQVPSTTASRTSASRLDPSPSRLDPSALANVRRTNGFNYVIVQSYHRTEQDRAEATRDALLGAGIPVTIETDIPGWPNRLCVVGTLGFERIRSNPDYRQYVDQIRKVSDAHRGDRRIKVLEPQPVHWTRG